MRKNIYFISDAHLGFKESETEIDRREKLLAFLDYVHNDKEVESLFLVGDIFDFWFEWYHVVPKYWFPVLYKLRQLVDSGITVNFITGNHDFYTGTYLQNEIGLNCFNESTQFERNSKRFFVAHGDGYAKKDRGYRLLKKIIRHPLSIFLYKTLVSPDLGMQMARWFSHSSRQLVKIEKKAWAEEYYKYALNKFAEGFDFVILGHIHYPLMRENDGKIFISCGDWITRFNFAKYDGTTLSLHQWNEI